jgi:hypothetical protein
MLGETQGLIGGPSVSRGIRFDAKAAYGVATLDLNRESYETKPSQLAKYLVDMKLKEEGNFSLQRAQEWSILTSP